MKNQIVPLNKGDLIDVIAPASKAPDLMVENSIAWLKSCGFKVRVNNNFNIGSEIFAADQKLQWNELKKSILAKDSKMIWCMRGGWGTIRFIPELLKLKKPKHQKIFLGFSDITAIHLFLNKKWGWTSYHGANLSAFGDPNLTEEQKNEYLDFILGKKKELIYSNLTLENPNQKNLKTKSISGEIIGGNLSIYHFYQALNLKQNRETKKILFLEDIGERGYKIDRYFEVLKQNGSLNNIKAIILGDFTDTIEPNGQNDYKNIAIKRLADKVKIPILSGMPCGHGVINKILPLNTPCKIDLTKMTITIQSGLIHEKK